MTGVEVDFNHPLAGHAITFDVEIIDVVPAERRITIEVSVCGYPLSPLGEGNIYCLFCVSEVKSV